MNDAFDNAATDREALRRALLALRTCPNCRGKLEVVFAEMVEPTICHETLGCEACNKVWLNEVIDEEVQ